MIAPEIVFVERLKIFADGNRDAGTKAEFFGPVGMKSAGDFVTGFVAAI